jgi:hypothetical protein
MAGQRPCLQQRYSTTGLDFLNHSILRIVAKTDRFVPLHEKKWAIEKQRGIFAKRKLFL